MQERRGGEALPLFEKVLPLSGRSPARREASGGAEIGADQHAAPEAVEPTFVLGGIRDSR